MDEQPRPVVVLGRALDQARAALTTLSPDDLDKPTPCEGWTVRELLAHLLPQPAQFLQMTRGEDVDWSATTEVGDGGWAERFREDADELMAHWATVPEEKAGMADMMTAELGVHTWDLLRATGHSMPLDPEVAERGLAFMQQGLTDENRVGSFAAAVELGEDATPYDRLVAFSGRDPSA